MLQAPAADNLKLSKRLVSWLAALEVEAALDSPAQLFEAEAAYTLAELSPLKKNKGKLNLPKLGAKRQFCWYFLLKLLGWRCCELSLHQPTTIPLLADVGSGAALQRLWQSYRAYPLTVQLAFDKFLTLAETPTSILRIVSEIGQLSATELNAQFLATLSPQPSQQATLLRKRTGSFYTPPALTQTIVAQTLQGLDLSTVQVLDPACGSGIFLITAFEWIVQHTNLTPEQAIAHIYGLELNPLARDLSLLSLLRQTSQLKDSLLDFTLLENLSSRIQVGNALIGNLYVPNSLQSNKSEQDLNQKQNELLAALPIFNTSSDGQYLVQLAPFHWQTKWPQIFPKGFDAVLGNPPYVGFNDYSGVEKAYFAHAYPEIYNLKNDLLYYFIKRGVDLLRPGGHLGYVTSRFWKEAKFAAPLRSWLATNVTLEQVHDFDLPKFFDTATIDVSLLFLTKNQPAPDHYLHLYQGEPALATTPLKIAQQALSGAPWVWLQHLNTVTSLLEKIKAQSLELGQLAACRTGVQTGCDEVFFVDTKASQLELESELLRPAIKNSQISFHGLNAATQIEETGLALIYPPLDLAVALEPEVYLERYPRLAQFLAPQRPRLEKRRHYDKPFPYYQLQWPRELAVFEASRKLVTPYKAPRNMFALDTNSFFFSTDVISVVFTRTAPLLGTRLEQFAANFLCSKLSTCQFRSYSKLMGGHQYDYYANPVKKLLLPTQAFAPEVPTSAGLAPTQTNYGETKAGLEANPSQPINKLIARLADPHLSAPERDELVYALYDLNNAEIELVEQLV
jgi:hypothetical protein